jgi:hypothetical protein
MAACEHQWWPCRGGARPCSGVTGLARSVMSSREHLGRMGKMRQGPNKRKELYAVLAMEDREGSGATVKSKRGKASNAAYPELGCSNRVVNEVREVVAELWVWCSGLRCCDTRARAQRSNGGGGVLVLCSERARGEAGRMRRWRVAWHGFSSLQASEGDAVALYARLGEPGGNWCLPSVGHDRAPTSEPD